MTFAFRAAAAFFAAALLAACDDQPEDAPVAVLAAPAKIDTELRAPGLTPAEIIARDARLGPVRAQSGELAASELVAAPETGVALGWGWRSLLGEAAPTICVEFAPAAASGQEIDLVFEEAEDSFDVQSALDVSASASVKGIGYEVSGEASFASNTSISGTESTFVIAASVMNPAAFAAPALNDNAIRLTADAVALARGPGGIDAFRRVCGDGFVSTLYSGAKLSAIVSVKTQTRSQKTRMSASVEGGGWGVKVKGAMSGSSESGDSSMRRKIAFHQAGGSRQDVPMDSGEIIAAVKGLARAADDAGRLFRLAVTPYESLRNWPLAEGPGPQDAELDQLAALHGAYAAIYNGIEDALADPTAHVAPMLRCPAAAAAQGALVPPEQRPACVVTFPVLTDAAAADAARALQDEALAALVRLRIDAQNCVAADGCVFEERNYRSPYALQVRAPIVACLLFEGGLVVRDLGEGVTEEACDASQLGLSKLAGNAARPAAVEAFLDERVRRPAKNRCARDPFLSGCLSNRVISEWATRIGMASAIDPQNAPARRAELRARGCAVSDTDPGSALDAVIWRSYGPADARDPCDA